MGHPVSSAEEGAARLTGRLAADVATALGRAERAVTRRLTQVLHEEGCSVEAWRALCLLADGQAHPMTQLAEAVLLPGSSVTRLVDRLVADNLVYRRADDIDRRRILVYATERGLTLQRRLAKRIDDEHGAILGRATPGEAAWVIALLARLS